MFVLCRFRGSYFSRCSYLCELSGARGAFIFVTCLEYSFCFVEVWAFDFLGQCAFECDVQGSWRPGEAHKPEKQALERRFL